MLADETECPFCAEVIKAKAIKCKHCGSVLSSASPGMSDAAAREIGPAAAANRATAAASAPGSELLYEGPGSQTQNLVTFVICGVFALLGLVMGLPVGLFWLVAALGFAGWAYLRVAYRIYRITTGRMEIQSGIILSRTENVLMIRAKDIRYRQTIGDRLFGLGTIDVMSSDVTAPGLSFRALRDAKRIYQVLSTTMEETARRHGVVHY